MAQNHTSKTANITSTTFDKICIFAQGQLSQTDQCEILHDSRALLAMGFSTFGGISLGVCI